MATRSSKCKACGARTTASAGFCQHCKSMRHHGYRRVKEENLVVDQAGGAWWIWDSRGDVLVTGKPTREAAIIALAAGDTEEDNEGVMDAATKKKTPARLDAEIAEALRAKKWQEQIKREDKERRARLARHAAAPTPEQLYEEHAADVAAGVFHGEHRGRAREFRRDRSTRKRIPDAVREAIEAGALEFIEGAYRRHAIVGDKEPCLTVGLVTDYLRQAHMPEDFRWATKDQQRTWTRTVLESMRRRAQVGSSIGGTARCYEPVR